MCDPISLVSLAGAAISAGAGMYESSQAASAMAATNRAQNDANNAWIAYQKQIHDQQALAEQQAREKATSAQQSTLNKISPEAQANTQTTEQQRLNSLYNKAGGSAPGGSGGASVLLSGENTGNQSTINSITSQVNQATSQARQRIAALATAGSYGGSFGGLGTTVPIELARGGNAINLQNAIRQGDLKTYGVEQQVQPVQYTLGPGTGQQAQLGKALGSLAGSLAGIGGPRAFGDVTGNVNAAAGGLSPAFTDAALASFNDPSVNWGAV